VSESDDQETTSEYNSSHESETSEKPETGSSEMVDHQNQTQNPTQDQMDAKKQSQHAEQSRTQGRSGRQFVIILYIALTGAAGAAGYLTGYFVDGLSAPMFLFIIPFPLSPLGFAAYGGLTIAIVIGIPLGLVIYISEYAESIET
jgi:hypothetical protein